MNQPRPHGSGRLSDVRGALHIDLALSLQMSPTDVQVSCRMDHAPHSAGCPQDRFGVGHIALADLDIQID